MKFSLLAEAALRLLFPESCNVCKTTLELTETVLCETCAHNLECRRLPLEADASTQGIGRHWACYTYETPVKELLQDLKFQQKTWLLKAFDAALEGFAPASIGSKIDFIVPVPLHRSKLMVREFNQSLLIARILGRKTGLPVLNALKKNFATPLQSSLSKHERSMNLRGAFKARSGKKLAGKTVLLVDDILTTGATAREAAATLKKAGAKHVELFTIARTELGRDKNRPAQKSKASS